MKSEQKKLILVVALLAGAVGIYVYVGRSPEPLGGVRFVCVETGKTVWLDQGDIPSILPATNPRTGRRTLIPATERDGKIYASERYAWGLLAEPEIAEVNKYVDPETLEVLDSPREQ